MTPMTTAIAGGTLTDESREELVEFMINQKKEHIYFEAELNALLKSGLSRVIIDARSMPCAKRIATLNKGSLIMADRWLINCDPWPVAILYDGHCHHTHNGHYQPVMAHVFFKTDEEATAFRLKYDGC